MKTRSQNSETGILHQRTKIHNVRFYNLTPRSINCMTFSQLTKRLALSREDGSIEIWNVEYAAFLEKTINKTPGNSVEGLAWAGPRLFSVGLAGYVIEWNLKTLEVLRKQHATGNSIWCLDINQRETQLALGTEEGFINIFDIRDDQLAYRSLFDKQEGRVLCCKFNLKGDVLVTGSIGAIRVWDAVHGHAIRKISFQRYKRKDVIIWSLAVLKNMNIIAGDSRGLVTIWDGCAGTQIEELPVSRSDVLSVAVDPSQHLLVCAGIDPTIRLYARTQIKREDMVFYRYVKYLQRTAHDHDVKVLLCANDQIFSGGVDGYLGISSTIKSIMTVSRYGPFLQNPCVVLAPAKKLLLLRYTDYLEIWRLGSSSGEPQAINHRTNTINDQQKYKRTTLIVDTPPEKLLEFKSKDGEPINCATLSPDGRWLAYSTSNEIRIFRFRASISGRSETKLSRLKYLPEQFTSASHLQFTSDSERFLFINAQTKQILIFKMCTNNTEEIDFTDCIDMSEHITDTVIHFSISQNLNYIVVADAERSIAVWNIVEGKHYKHCLNLPKYSAPTTAISVHPNQSRIVASFSDGKILEYDLERRYITCSENEYFVQNAETHCVSNIALVKKNPDVFVMHNDETLYALEKCDLDDCDDNHDIGNNKTNKKNFKKSKKSLVEPPAPGLRLKYKTPFKHLIHLSWLSPNELVAVGVNPLSLLENIKRGAYKQKKFGVS